MFEHESLESAAGGGGMDYAFVEPLAPGAVDPVRLAALVDGLDAGYGLLDPEEFALVGLEPGVDPARVPGWQTWRLGRRWRRVGGGGSVRVGGPTSWWSRRRTHHGATPPPAPPQPPLLPDTGPPF